MLWIKQVLETNAEDVLRYVYDAQSARNQHLWRRSD